MSGRRNAVEAGLGVAALALFVVYFGVHSFRYPRVGDHLRHVASVASLYRSFTHPPHEAMPMPGTESEVHTPYIVAVAALGRALRVSPYVALEIAGVANLIFYAWAVWFFFRTFSIVSRSFVPPVAFLVVSLFLRSRVYHWSSETSFPSMRLIQSYPSLFAWAAALTVFSVAERHLRYMRFSTAAAIGVLVAALLPSHILTASWVVGILFVQAVFELLRPRGPHSRRAAMTLVGAGAVGGAFSFLWPYFDALRTFGLLRIPEGSEFGAHPFADQAGLYVLAAPAAVAFFRLRRHVFWLAGFVATFCALQVFRHAGLDFGNRYAFFQAFFAQAYVAETVGVAAAIVSGRFRELEGIARPRALQTAFLMIAAAAILLTVTAPVARTERMAGRRVLSFRELFASPSTELPYYSKLGDVGRRLGPRDVVLMPVEPEAWNVAAITRASVVVSLVAYRVPDYGERVRDVQKFFVAGFSATERTAILRRWRANRILVTPSASPLVDELTRQFGTPLARQAGLVLFAGPPQSAWGSATGSPIDQRW